MRYFTEIKTNEEFHANGKLAYTETRAYLLPATAHLFDNKNKLVNDKGEQSVRIGRNAKYYDNGQLAWELNYDNNGNIIKDNKPSYRKDGTIITY